MKYLLIVLFSVSILSIFTSLVAIIRASENKAMRSKALFVRVQSLERRVDSMSIILDGVNK